MNYKKESIQFLYEIYPSNSIAILHMQTFDDEFKDSFLAQYEKFKTEVDKQNIKYIFYDMTSNGGGHHLGYEALNIVKHDSIIHRVTHIERKGAADVERKIIKKVLLTPNHHDNNIPDNRQLFILQSSYTASGADYFCRIVADNKLGVLVGEPTGELTKTFSSSYGYTMPNTKTEFCIASTFVDYSKYFNSLTTEPNIYWNLKNFDRITKQELLDIVNYYKK